MSETVQLVRWERVKQAIIEAHSVDELKQIRDEAEAYRYALKLAGEAPGIIRKAEEIKVRAERRAGEFLKEQGPKPGNPQLSQDSIITPRLSALNITANQSSNWQRIAEIPEDKFEEFIATIPEISTSGALRVAAECKREKIQSRKTEIAPPSGKYRVVYADPPWTYEKGKKLSIWKYGDVYKEYPTMELADICALPISNITENDSVLFLWATMPKLPEALSVIEAWGFQYKTGLIWDKIRHNYGFYFSMRHELLLVGGRGCSTPDIQKLHDSVIVIERSDRHSAKPPYFRQLIDQLYISGKRIELFYRGEKPDGWDVWGYDV